MQGGRLGARDRGAAAQEGQVARVPERGREREREEVGLTSGSS
jgi:hypothetical protein